MQICNIKPNNYCFYCYQMTGVKFGQQKKSDVNISYDSRNAISSIKFKHPITLKETAEFLMQPEIHDNLKNYFNLTDRNIENLATSKLSNVKVKALLGYGTSACAFLMDNDKVLKLTRGQHLNRKLENFDIPVYDQGILLLDNPYNVHYYIEEYGDTKKVLEKEAINLINEIEEAGYKIFDVYTDITMENIYMSQFGKAADGKVYLLDPECVFN